jgi:hypothetical protein
MASGGTVEIQVELEGANKVQGRLNQLGQGATVAGQKFTAAGDALASSSNLMASSLGTVVSSVGTLTQGIGGLTAATQTAGAGFTAMLGPIAAIGTAIVGVALAIRQYISTSDDMETRLEALKAAAAEYTSVIEGLADENITLTDAERERIKALTRESKFLTEYIQKVREGEGVAGQRLQRYQREYVAAQRAVEQIQRLQLSEAAYLELSREERRRLATATAALEREENKLRTTEERAMALRREQANLLEQIREERGRSALAAQAEAARKAEEQAATALQNIQTLQLRLNAEAIQASGASLADRVSLLRVELAERKRVIGESIADEQERLTAIAAADQAFAAKRRALYRAESQQRQARRAQEAAAAEATERALFQDRQRLREEEIRRDAQGFEQQRQLIELRFETAQRMAQNEIQTQTAVLVQRRELLAVQQQEQEAARKATAERLTALQQSFALMQQDLALLEVYDRAKQLDIELTREQAQALADLNATDMSTITNAISSFSQGLMHSAFAALQSGKSFKAATGEALKSIAIQAGVESVMETARGIAALATGLPTDAVLAAKHFQAAAFFATAAGAAGVVGAKLSPNGGGGGGGGGASPTGTAQSVRDFDRDEREERGGVTINVNMGQATIYDTRAAAERAFADRVVSAINSPRRGAVRLRRS